MPGIGVNIAIMKDGKILLTKREDFEIWCLPGGGVNEGETLAQAAIRETREETGLEVELVRLVGVYSRPRWTNESPHVLLFAARPVGGVLRPNPSEVLEARYFGAQEIPTDLVVDHALRIQHAFSGAGGSLVWVQDTPWPLPSGLPREELYRMRDESGVSKRDFYLTYFGESDPGRNRPEIHPEREDG